MPFRDELDPVEGSCIFGSIIILLFFYGRNFSISILLSAIAMGVCVSSMANSSMFMWGLRQTADFVVQRIQSEFAPTTTHPDPSPN